MANSQSKVRRYGIVIGVAVLLVTAGCAGFGTSEEQPTQTETTTAPATQTTEQQTTEQQTTESGTGQTTTQSDTDNGTSGGESRSAAASGAMAVVVDDERLDVAAAAETNESSAFWVEDADGTAEWQRTDEEVTLAEGLSKLGVNVTENGIEYEGTTYQDSEDNTSVAVRVNGESVDPEEYVLQQGDEVWVVAITHPLDQSVPGDHIDHDELHVHGQVDMTVDGEDVNFSEPKYETPGHNQHFHFEGDSAPLWHAHSWSVTLEYGMSTLAGINVTEDSVTYDNTTYERNDPGTSLTIEVNGESVDPSRYVLKDGDEVTIEVETENGTN